MKCIFCEIIKKKIPAEILYEDEKFLVFKDISPKAPIHLLICPKKHISSINTLNDKNLAGEMILLAKKNRQKIKNFQKRIYFGF